MVSHHRASWTVGSITTTLSVIVCPLNFCEHTTVGASVTSTRRGDNGAEHFKGGGGRLFGLLSGLRRPPDLGYFYRRIFPQKVAFGTRKSELFYSSSQRERITCILFYFGELFRIEASENLRACNCALKATHKDMALLVTGTENEGTPYLPFRVDSSFILAALVLIGTAPSFGQPATAPDKPHYRYYRSGHPNDLVTKPQQGAALMGGGTDQDPAFRWLCERAHGGDFLILTATGGNDYNPYINQLCKVNSVATLAIPDREAARIRFVADTIRHAEAIFITGGDQSNYIKYWQGTPVQTQH